MKNISLGSEIYLKCLWEYYSHIKILTPQTRVFLKTREPWIINELWHIKPHGSWVLTTNIETWEIVNFDFFYHKNIPVFDKYKFHQFLDSKFEKDMSLKTKFSSNLKNRHGEYEECLQELLGKNIIEVNNWMERWYYLAER